MSGRLTLSLVSHTNVGKTTLARTLLGKDVGEVRDRAHVTEESTRHVLVTDADGGELVLWDTPGFGDSARLLARLRASEEPLKAFFAQTWDRLADRPLWCGQQAARNVRDEADCVLYLVNGAENPEDAGYVHAELELLAWIGRPVLLLLNQTGPPREAGERRAEEDAWRTRCEGFDIVRGVLGLDAFTRCWVQEGALLEAVREALPLERRSACDPLLEAWMDERRVRWRTAMSLIAKELWRAGDDREELEEGALRAGRRRGMERLAARLENGLGRALDELIELHGIEGRGRAELRTALKDFAATGGGLSPRKLGLRGAVISGFIGGLAADLASGGFSLGGGMLLGAAGGWLAGHGAGRAVEWVSGKEHPCVEWTPGLLERLAQELLLRYLAVAHFGRGQGNWRDGQGPGFWSEHVARALAERSEEFTGALETGRADGGGPAALEAVLTDATRAALVACYPRAARLL
ncbi:MAG: DUF3482 domain-containing protein [Planctomycetota bacterium]|jgi:hypothetical protein|nr:DUF3482 domain-containing protein [Planctomycetota bacterium]